MGHPGHESVGQVGGGDRLERYRAQFLLGVVRPSAPGQRLGAQQPGQRPADRGAEVEGEAEFAGRRPVLAGRGREQAAVVVHQALELRQPDPLRGRGCRVTCDARLA